MQKLKNWLGGAAILVFVGFSARALFTDAWDIPSNFQMLLMAIFGAMLAVEPIQEGLKRRREAAEAPPLEALPVPPAPPAEVPSEP